MSDVIYKDNTFRSDEIYEMYLGRVIRRRQQAGENTDNLRLYVDVELGIGGPLNDVPYYGGGVDLITEFPHGLFVPPRENQIVLIMFLRGDSQNPVACCPVPHPRWKKGEVDSTFETDKAKYNNIMSSLDDITLFHYSGSRISLKENGKIEIAKKIGATEHKVEIEITATKVIVDMPSATTVEFGAGATESFVKGDAFKTYFDSHFHTTPMGPSGSPVNPVPADSLSTKNKTV